MFDWTPKEQVDGGREVNMAFVLHVLVQEVTRFMAGVGFHALGDMGRWLLWLITC